jgi:hypothetical protein
VRAASPGATWVEARTATARALRVATVATDWLEIASATAEDVVAVTATAGDGVKTGE